MPAGRLRPALLFTLFSPGSFRNLLLKPPDAQTNAPKYCKEATLTTSWTLVSVDFVVSVERFFFRPGVGIEGRLFVFKEDITGYVYVWLPACLPGAACLQLDGSSNHS